VCVFLDEVNACNHMGLICEIITKRSLNGSPLHDKIHILAALNPYRRRPKNERTFGLIYKHKKRDQEVPFIDDMASLVYRVTPIPSTMRDFVFDFGSLESEQERLYIRSMIQSMVQFPTLPGMPLFVL
jgi:E3 ubiquitin-protein ligase RNF213